VIAPGIPQASGKQFADLQHSDEFVKEVYAAKMRQTRMVTSDLQIFWRSSHCEPHLTKSEVSLTIAKCAFYQQLSGIW